MSATHTGRPKVPTFNAITDGTGKTVEVVIVPVNHIEGRRYTIRRNGSGFKASVFDGETLQSWETGTLEHVMNWLDPALMEDVRRFFA